MPGTEKLFHSLVLPTGPVPQVVFICPPKMVLDLASFQYRYATAAGAATTMALRKITDSSAAGAAASATVLELLGVAGAGTEDMTAAAAVTRTPVLIGAAGTAQASFQKRRLKPGEALAVNIAGTPAALAGLNLTFLFYEVGQNS